MNFLAHAYLSGPDEKLLTGNFIGDFVKGRQALSAFDPDIARGVELHRLIDDFTDNHPLVMESKKRLRPKYRHYSAVIVDVYYDHFLAKNWAAFHPLPLEKFAQHVYTTITKFSDILPAGVRYMLPYMMRGNWLVNYSRLEGIGRALTGMAQRTPYLSKMEQAVSDLELNYELFYTEFRQFFPLLRARADAFITKGER
jgi:acyl carrier protein phosphodiesterase